jgi:hypothetical protein
LGFPLALLLLFGELGFGFFGPKEDGISWKGRREEWGRMTYEEAEVSPRVAAIVVEAGKNARTISSKFGHLRAQTTHSLSGRLLISQNSPKNHETPGTLLQQIGWLG